MNRSEFFVLSKCPEVFDRTVWVFEDLLLAENKTLPTIIPENHSFASCSQIEKLFRDFTVILNCGP